MDKKSPVISVCVITYKRPEQLRILLESLAAQTMHARHKVEIIIVDNDAEGTAELIVKKFTGQYPDITVIYEIELLQGIPQARNHSVRLARGDYIAFIDDDERADNRCLEALYHCLTNYHADAVLGPVEPVLPNNCSGWLRKGRFYDRPHHRDGSVVPMGRTGNALVEKSWLQRFESPFDPDLRFTGGSDSDFFARIQKQGAKLCWAEHAKVYEFVGRERLKLKWLLMRAFRGGQGHAWRHATGRNPTGKISHFLYRFVLACFSLVMVLASLPFGRHRSVWWLRKVFSNAGQISAFLPFRYEEYKHSNYR
ncbi:MAG: glycosyltransferase family 2 protein [Deltaproteobacteria bacterium]|nr:glycosyltransferase family 2 protein [Deltaproteobacteria bacterium]